MLRFWFPPCRPGRLGAWLSAILLGTALGGCADLRTQRPPSDDLGAVPRKMRQAGADDRAAGMSSQAVEIERNLGYR